MDRATLKALAQPRLLAEEEIDRLKKIEDDNERRQALYARCVHLTNREVVTVLAEHLGIKKGRPISVGRALQLLSACYYLGEVTTQMRRMDNHGMDARG